jgi:hypothetical protein
MDPNVKLRNDWIVITEGAEQVGYVGVRKEWISNMVEKFFCVENSNGQNVVLARNGEVIIIDAKERELERFTIPNGAVLMVAENDEIKTLRISCRRHSTRKIKYAIKNIRWNRTRFERTNHAPVCYNVGELHYADLKIT